MTDDSRSTAERIERVEELIRAVERGEMTVAEGKEALDQARQLIEGMQAEFDDSEGSESKGPTQG
jgi:exonuclease VII small subunit